MLQLGQGFRRAPLIGVPTNNLYQCVMVLNSAWDTQKTFFFFLITEGLLTCSVKITLLLKEPEKGYATRLLVPFFPSVSLHLSVYEVESDSPALCWEQGAP